VHKIVVAFVVLLALSLCGVVGTTLWLVKRRGHRVVARDLIPLIGYSRRRAQGRHDPLRPRATISPPTPITA